LTRKDLVLKGVVPSMIAPLRAGKIDWDALDRELTLFSAHSVTGVGVGGGLGELAGMSAQEFGEVCRFVRGRTDLPVIATILPDSEPEASDLMQSAVSAGVDAVCLAQPHYLFQTNSTDLLSFFGRMRSRSSIPLLLANTSLTSGIPSSIIASLIDEALIDGLVQGGSDPHVLVDVLALQNRPPVFCAIEELAYTALLLGAEGISSTLAAVFPAELCAMFAAMQNADHLTARALHERLLRLWRALDHPAESFARIRCVLAAQGRDVGEAHAPFNVTRSEMVSEVSSALTREGFHIHASR
jgi:4-hydroxy-tetrahydrodipicolinate synthase